MTKYKHILFDLDNTLWNFDKNSKEALSQVFDKYKLETHFGNFENFDQIFDHHNLILWKKYIDGEIDKYALCLRRFNKTLETVNISDPELAARLNSEYLANTTLKTELMPDAFEILVYLRHKYEMHILTNGFYEVQFLKLRNSKLQNFFVNLFTSEETQALKPNSKFFDYVLERIQAKPEECIMIGDSYEIDIIGASNVGIEQIFFNYKKKTYQGMKPTYEIINLSEIKNIW